MKEHSESHSPIQPVEQPPFSSYLLPQVTVVVPTYNSSMYISHTIESVLSQAYPDLDLIVVDGGSTDRTMEIVGAYFDQRVRMCSVAGYDPFEMLNKGISLANGDYIQFLIPGNYILSENSLKQMMDISCEYQHPLLVYGAHLAHDEEEAHIVKHPLREEILKIGIQPTTLSSCWFKKELFKKIGKFSTDYLIRGDFDLFCRFVKADDLSYRSSSLVTTDTDLKGLTRKELFTHFKETFLILRKHFGLFVALKWFWYQKELSQLFKGWLRQIKHAFIGR